MGKTKSEKNQKVSSFFVSSKVRTRSQKETKAIKPLLMPINDINNVSKTQTSKTRTVRKGSKLPAGKTGKKPNTTLDSFIKGKVVKDKDETIKENTPVKRVLLKPKNKSDTAHRRRALIERVRAKGQKTIEETFGMDPIKKKQKTMLSRAREIANSLSFHYISMNKTVMYVKEAATRIAESSGVPISEYEAVEHFELLTKIAPKWCQFSTTKNNNDLLKINTSISAKEAVEEGIKNFDEPTSDQNKKRKKLEDNFL